MEIKKGRSRIAFVGTKYTIKIPRIKPVAESVLELKSYLEMRDHELIKDWFLDKNSPLSWKWGLSGWLQNLREALLSSSHPELIVPTRLSLLGLINLQETAPDLPDNIRNKILEILEANAHEFLNFDAHTFANHENYGLHEGVVKLRDYGVDGLKILLKEHSARLKTALKEILK